jgi:hypothetical protein
VYPSGEEKPPTAGATIGMMKDKATMSRIMMTMIMIVMSMTTMMIRVLSLLTAAVNRKKIMMIMTMRKTTRMIRMKTMRMITDRNPDIAAMKIRTIMIMTVAVEIQKAAGLRRPETTDLAGDVDFHPWIGKK